MLRVSFYTNLAAVLFTIITYLTNPIAGFLALSGLGFIQIIITIILISYAKRYTSFIRTQLLIYCALVLFVLILTGPTKSLEHGLIFLIYASPFLALFHLIICFQTIRKISIKNEL